jgi:hypothetical protein
MLAADGTDELGGGDGLGAGGAAAAAHAGKKHAAAITSTRPRTAVIAPP